MGWVRQLVVEEEVLLHSSYRMAALRPQEMMEQQEEVEEEVLVAAGQQPVALVQVVAVAVAPPFNRCNRFTVPSMHNKLPRVSLVEQLHQVVDMERTEEEEEVVV